MKANIGFIGCGNIANAMIGGLVKSKAISPQSIMVSNRTPEKLEKINAEYNVLTTIDNKKVANFADVLILSVKTNKYYKVIDEIKDSINSNTIVVSLAAGRSIHSIEEAFAKKVKIVRTMPNIPAIVGEAMSALCHNHLVTKEEFRLVLDIFKSFGEVEVVDEELMDVVTAISGSSPALVYLFIESLADGAVLKGFPRNKAYKMVSQAVLGAAKIVLETGKHPGQLKDEVCSSGGTTIEAIYSLEKKGFRGHVIEAIDKGTEKSMKLAGK
ncbi:pyrroline-5-carboxylate reductase [Paramaledivibacter caminithermalis]|jgi:pyrroline-5-carboxylate reductase|uniref:Pyrroline-5-carboxylate reductase n=1 Tax=Paramaledivibacter caminithermalis (strain DSM 15212 / CIP 107654 / DViRD3) TaxID=1121301 RepID=A0A1M6N1Y7_PARC5|nr:pyrroline-5-carboxylate reductase [Paramaledivibacter caminithermalis]SHJ89749.1 pyrroline-5-carboxylate reductase [Paramaledivibacter caminithermalis DSM 15212]